MSTSDFGERPPISHRTSAKLLSPECAASTYKSQSEYIYVLSKQFQHHAAKFVPVEGEHHSVVAEQAAVAQGH